MRAHRNRSMFIPIYRDRGTRRGEGQDHNQGPSEDSPRIGTDGQAQPSAPAGMDRLLAPQFAAYVVGQPWRGWRNGVDRAVKL
jgi:hypothetical protein